MTRTGHNSHGNGHPHITETPDVSHIKNLDVTHEVSDVNISGILKFVAALTVFGIVVFVLMWGMFRFLNAQEVKKEPQPGPMAMTEQERLPPEPRLQAAKGFGVKLENGQWINLEKREPEAEYRVLREQWERQLNCKEQDKSGHGPDGEPAQLPRLTQLQCVPIDQAIQKLIESGLPSRSQANTSESAADISLPTAASSGRMTEKGK
jgi:hypothetical protein